MSTPRIGCVKYLNARPLIRGWLGPVDFDHPAALCRKLASGFLDVALVSSIEYLRRPRYRIVDGISISADGPVYSVIITHAGELPRAQAIRVDPESETSVALLRCLLLARNSKTRLIEGDSQPSKSQLLIGDQAIRFRQEHPEVRVVDLAQDWKNLTGLPFVFALWLVRPEVANASEIADRLRAVRDENLHRINDVIREQSEFDAEFCYRYFREHLHFAFAKQEKAGLREFHRQSLTCRIKVASEFELNLV